MTFYTRHCDHCGQAYRGQGVRFCSAACRDDHRRPEQPYKECAHCHKQFAIPYMKATQGFRYEQIYCGRECSDEAQRTWYIDKHGYRCTNRMIDGKKMQCYEHREVMERHLGRKLLSRETVHHKNMNRLDNHIENLELWSGRHGKGGRLSERLTDAFRLLAENGVHAGVSINDFAAGVVLG